LAGIYPQLKSLTFLACNIIEKFVALQIHSIIIMKILARL